MSGYYEALGLQPKLALDLKDLEKRFYAQSRKLHPDVARGIGDDAMATLNDAYRTLRDPVKRAVYLLQIGEQSTKDVPADLLEEIFELNMAVEEGAELRAKFEEMRAAIDADLQAKFEAFDAGQDVSGDIRMLLNKRKYISNLISKSSQDSSDDTNVPD